MLKRTRGEVVFDGFNTLVMLFIIVVMLLPFILVLNGSLVTENEFLAKKGVVLIPDQLSFSSYEFLFKGTDVVKSFFVSLLRTAVGVPFSLLMTLLLAYAMTKREMPYHKALMVFLVVMMYFDGGMIPFLLMVRDIKLYNTFMMYVLPYGVSVFYAIILRNFMDTIPGSLLESARIDGAGELHILFRIVLPLSIPGIATIALFYAVMHWNDWFTGVGYMQGNSLIPLQTFLKRMIDASQYDLMSMGAAIQQRPPLPEALKMATIVITTLPIVCVYPFVQKYFVKGLLIGSVKE